MMKGRKTYYKESSWPIITCDRSERLVFKSCLPCDWSSLFSSSRSASSVSLSSSSSSSFDATLPWIARLLASWRCLAKSKSRTCWAYCYRTVYSIKFFPIFNQQQRFFEMFSPLFKTTTAAITMGKKYGGKQCYCTYVFLQQGFNFLLSFGYFIS